jgi:hypothetical protein
MSVSWIWYNKGQCHRLWFLELFVIYSFAKIIVYWSVVRGVWPVEIEIIYLTFTVRLAMRNERTAGIQEGLQWCGQPNVNFKTVENSSLCYLWTKDFGPYWNSTIINSTLNSVNSYKIYVHIIQPVLKSNTRAYKNILLCFCSYWGSHLLNITSLPKRTGDTYRNMLRRGRCYGN